MIRIAIRSDVLVPCKVSSIPQKIVRPFLLSSIIQKMIENTKSNCSQKRNDL